eukprot:1160926-Pelagomonas_calceolata.AAC.8
MQNTPCPDMFSMTAGLLSQLECSKADGWHCVDELPVIMTELDNVINSQYAKLPPSQTLTGRSLLTNPGKP